MRFGEQPPGKKKNWPGVCNPNLMPPFSYPNGITSFSPGLSRFAVPAGLPWVTIFGIYNSVGVSAGKYFDRCFKILTFETGKASMAPIYACQYWENKHPILPKLLTSAERETYQGRNS